MARKEIEYTVIVGKEGSPVPRWSRPNVAMILVQIAQRLLEKKQAAGGEAALVAVTKDIGGKTFL